MSIGAGDFAGSARSWIVYDQKDLHFTTATSLLAQPLICQTTAHRILQRLVLVAGLPRVRFHALRHAFATTVLADGEDLANVAKLLGRRDPATTANAYGHVTDLASRRAAD
jgi:site-specific recombinase XerD